jgi:hypothetical protein
MCGARACPSPTLFFFPSSSLLWIHGTADCLSSAPSKSATNSSDLSVEIDPHPFLKVFPFDSLRFIH